MENPIDQARRSFVAGGIGLAGLATAWPGVGVSQARSRIGFSSVAPSLDDTVHVPAGYSARVLLRWGEPVGALTGSPAMTVDASSSAADQALQAGMHHDGMSYFPINGSSNHGLLAINHEYTDERLLHGLTGASWGPAQALKSKEAVGVSVVEVVKRGDQWHIVRPSPYARRISLSTLIAISGPAAGHALMKTAQDPQGGRVLGTMMNCANGWTPWGTYLTCEENFQAYFPASDPATLTLAQMRYGIGGRGYAHHQFDPRFDASRTPNESNRFGWVVEIDPFKPEAMPVKRTAMGRFKHEAAVPHIGKDRRVAFYLSDDEPFEYFYKFVTAEPLPPAGQEPPRDMLDRGTLYVARFDSAGRGVWLPLVHGTGPLTVANGFADQASILVHARLAADALGATTMDRPEGCAVDIKTHDVFLACTNNTARSADGGRTGTNPANPRPNNFFGHILRMREENDAVGATQFSWSLFLMGGDSSQADSLPTGSTTTKPPVGVDGFGSPDNLFMDSAGLLWIQTDMSGSLIGKPPYANLGNNQVLAADPVSGEVRRFLTVPRGAEATGCVLTADRKTMFLNVQHPGESVPSNWPDGGLPRSATIVVTKDDGGVIGS